MTSTTKITTHYILIIATSFVLSQVACSFGIVGQEKSITYNDEVYLHSDQSDRSKDETNNTSDELGSVSKRYITFAPSSSDLSVQAMESIRLISIYKENHPNSDIIITSTSQEQAQSNAHNVKTLIEKFGIQSNHIKVLIREDYGSVTDTTLLINVIDNQPKNYKYVSAAN